MRLVFFRMHALWDSTQTRTKDKSRRWVKCAVQFHCNEEDKNDEAQQDNRVDPGPPPEPGRKAAGHTDDRQEADQAHHEEVVEAEAVEYDQ